MAAESRGRRWRRGLGAAGVGVAVAVGLLAAACGDPFEAFLIPVADEPTEATLVDFATGPLQDPSAYDLIVRQSVRVDQTAQWDFLFTVTSGGQAQLLPVGAVVEAASEAGLQHVSEGFEELRRAPAEGYERTSAVAIAEGDVLAAVSRRDPGFGGRCRNFAKLEILRLELAGPAPPTLTFRTLVNPNCELRILVPGARADDG